MARPRKKQGFRLIVVDGVRYRWRCDNNRTADVEIHFESDTTARGQRLCVNQQWTTDQPPIEFISNRLVADIIRLALESGWQPQNANGDFVVNWVEHSPSIRFAARS